MITSATALMAIAAVVAEALHRRIRHGQPVSRLAAANALRIALVAMGMAIPTIMIALFKVAGL